MRSNAYAWRAEQSNRGMDSHPLLGAELSLEIGTVWISLEQFADLSPGMRFSVNLPERNILSLYDSDGQEFARGILVEDDAGLSLQITEVLDGAATQQNQQIYEK